MRDDPVALLERELVDAARRRAQPAPAAGTPPLARRRRGSLGAFAAVALSGVAVVVALGAIVSFRGHPASAPRAAHQPAAVTPGRQQLIDILGVLRRPQTKADLSWWLRQASPGMATVGTADVALIRRVGVTPWGSGILLIPMKRRGLAEGIDLEVDSGGACCATASSIETYGEMVTGGAGSAFAGGSTQTRLTVVVPDGVARVKFVLPRQPDPSDPGAPIYPSVLTVSAPVHENVAAVQVKRECCGAGVALIWLAADGRVIKQVGDVAAASRVVRPPQPGPETALSRAAERDPATPNRVWVTPAVGTADTTFSVHFRLLLNDADYRYTFSGAACPRHTFPGGGGGGAGDLRGRVWSDSLTAVQGQSLCPGTYHVSVAVMDLGRYGYLKQPARPFGTATFTVTH